jgi:hypothetical protein
MHEHHSVLCIYNIGLFSDYSKTYEIWGFHSGENLDYDDLSFTPCSLVLELEDEGSIFLWNVGNQLQDYAVAKAGRLEF